jgi:hypothetical protein
MISLLMSLAALGQDVFSSGGQPQPAQGVIISITDFYNGNCDVKIKSLRTGYIHSFTVPCGFASGFRPGDPTIETGNPRAPFNRPGGNPGNNGPISPAFPKLVASPDSSPAFKKALKDCLEMITSLASADSASPINRLLASLTSIPITVHPRAATDTSNATASSPAGKPVDIYWSPMENSRYADDGASKIPCATLLHELTHAWENYNGLDNGELQAVRAENWFIWKSKGTQRTKYGPTTLPRNSVVWPQAAN